MKNILIMGGTTFVSSSLAKHYIKQGYNIDILTRGIKTLDYNGFINHLICNRKSKSEVVEVLKKKSYEYIFDISAYTKEDVEILLTSIDKTNLKGYIFCSSGAVYKPSDEPINEEDEKGENPNWGKYGTDKKEAEDYIINSKIPYVIFRPTYIYGEGNNLYREGYFFDRIKNKKPIPMPYGNNTKTQFIHIDDLVKIFESAMIMEKKNKIYNITNPDIVTFEDLINICGKALNEKPNIIRIDTNKVRNDVRTYFPFRDVTYMLNIKKLIDYGLHVPSISLKEGIIRAYTWYLDKKPQLEDKRMNMMDEI
ncbi:NAD-dependent epimerase/dehydratase family protein [Clostridium sp. 'White wine YQ']|uniref:NAD-dependent epimerase/dehydratase family protein n=1 Tax=Clostridium sp. 'White wine YQ' TaxID=3027474 RepID=UPI0023656A7F|nr:NAD-dependent epimerase/dehydratase family protein [Clostridium sp. 'White wine YQ']MDD7794129.1 NAD-dependent epimerase/dehydratase family protein [Clostridium sp. 'White wine YQ']